MIYIIGYQNNWQAHPIKIGFTNSDPHQRLKSLQVGNPEALEIVHTMEGTVNEEVILHKLLRKYKLKGEWFAAFNIPSEHLGIIFQAPSAIKLIDDLSKLGYKRPAAKQSSVKSEWLKEMKRMEKEHKRFEQWLHKRTLQKVKSIKENLCRFKVLNPNVDILRSKVWRFHTEIRMDIICCFNLIDALHCVGLWDKEDLLESISHMYPQDIPVNINKSHRDYHKAIRKLSTDGYMEFNDGLTTIEFDEKAYLNKHMENYGDDGDDIVFVNPSPVSVSGMSP